MLVSILTPTYNRSNLLPRAADSVYRQSYEPIEHIIIDDGSTDDTKDVVNGFEYDNLKYVRLDENSGVSTARNVGIERANGQYVLFLDADDELVDNAVSTLVEEQSRMPEDCIGTFGNEWLVYESGKSRRFTNERERQVRYEDIVLENCIGPIGGKLIRRQVFDEVGNFDIRYPSGEDFDFFMRAFKRGYWFKYLNELLYCKHLRDDQLSRDTEKWITGQRKLLDTYREDLTPRHRAVLWLTMGVSVGRDGDFSEARRYFRHCIRLRPGDPLYWICYISSALGLFDKVLEAYGLLTGRSR